MTCQRPWLCIQPCPPPLLRWWSVCMCPCQQWPWFCCLQAMLYHSSASWPSYLPWTLHTQGQCLDLQWPQCPSGVWRIQEVFLHIYKHQLEKLLFYLTLNDNKWCIRDIVVWFTDLSQWPCRWFLCPPVYICRFHYQLGWHLEFPVCEHFHHQWLWCVLMTRFPCCLWTICPWLLV